MIISEKQRDALIKDFEDLSYKYKTRLRTAKQKDEIAFLNSMANKYNRMAFELRWNRTQPKLYSTSESTVAEMLMV